jgi:hypothetical protein
MKPKNLFLFVIIVTLSVVMAACSGSSSQASSTTGTNGTAGAQGKSSLSKVNMLLVGTLKLEGTDQAVPADEAANLLPLWQAYRSLSNSQTTAEAEVDALLNQIESTMSADQVKVIEALNLTNTDMMSLMQSMGGGMGPQSTPNPQDTPGFNVPSGGFTSNLPSGSAGGPPSGSNGGPPSGSAIMIGPGGDAGSAAGLGGGPMLQGTQNPSMQATAQARFSTQANKVNTILLDVLINKLEAITTQ